MQKARDISKGWISEKESKSIHLFVYIIVATVLLSSFSAFAQPSVEDYDPYDFMFCIPSDKSEWANTRNQIASWRQNKISSLGYTGAVYSDPDYEWIQQQFLMTYLNFWDRNFYDYQTDTYDFNSYFQFMSQRYGEIDLIGLGYYFGPLGLDMRNNFVFFRMTTGGLTGLAGIVQDMHNNGVYTYLMYLPWDTDTNLEPNPYPQSLVDMVVAVSADGSFTDTSRGVDAGTREALAQVTTGPITGSEHPPYLDEIEETLFSIMIVLNPTNFGIVKPKYFERRHMIFCQDDHEADGDLVPAILLAVFNGCGINFEEDNYLINEIPNAKSLSLINLTMPIMRRYWRHFTNSDQDGWIPLVGTFPNNVFASKWEHEGT